VTARHLAVAFPDAYQRARLVLMETTGEIVVNYESFRSFRRIQRDGEWWRLAGADRATGEMVYLREELEVSDHA
jgi:hypothetical protein